MLRFKQFEGSGGDLEATVNAWLAEIEPDVTQMSQIQTDEGASRICFLFEESFRGQEIRLSAERGMPETAMPGAPTDVMPDKPIGVEVGPVPPPLESR